MDFTPQKKITIDVIPIKPEVEKTIDFNSILKGLSLNGSSQKMKQQMVDDIFVLGNVALLGQATVFYAEPNTGKTLLTLWMLIEKIKEGDLIANDVYYINADDNFRGLQSKLEYAEKYRFNMLAPGHNGMDSSMVERLMSDSARAKQANGKVFILDTLKKFADIMDKASQRRFNTSMREFTSQGGTVIMLAHTNKHRGYDGKLIHAGTSDMRDDSDCVYLIDEVSNEGGRKTIMFTNDKDRGDVIKQCCFSYSVEEGVYYGDLLESVKLESSDTTKGIVERDRVKGLELKYSDELEFIVDNLKQSNMTASTLEDKRKESEQLFGKHKLNDCLKAFNGDRWKTRLTPNHSTAKEFYLTATPTP